MPHRLSRSATRQGGAHHSLGWSALLFFACSVFPNQATLPGGQGGNESGGSGSGTGGVTPGSGGTGLVGGAGGADGGDRGAGGSSGSGGSGGWGGSGGSGGAAEAGSAGDNGTVHEGGQGGAPGCSTPLVLALPASADAYITNMGNDDRTNFGDGMRLLISGVATAEARALVNFDLSSLPNQKISRAALRVVLAAPLEGERSLSIFRLGRAWTEDKVTWVRASTAPTVNWAAAGGDIAITASDALSIADAPAGTAIEFDVAPDLQAFSAGGDNFGFLLAVTAAQGVLELSSKESLFPEERPELLLELCP